MKDAPSLAEILEMALDGRLDDVRVSLPGRIESYDESRRRAVVQVLPSDGFDDETGARKAVTIRPLVDVPVGHWGSGSMRIKMPISKGDQCWIMFSSSSIAKLKATGKIAPYDPGDDRHHHLADAVALPIVVVGSDVEDDPLIAFTDDEVQLGEEGAAQSVIRGDARREIDDDLVDALDTFFDPNPVTGPLAKYADAIKGIVDSSPPGFTQTNALLTAIGQVQLALQTFKASLAGTLSSIVKVP